MPASDPLGRFADWINGLLPGHVEVRYRGLLGNRLGQYCLGRIIAQELGFTLAARPIPGFPNAKPVGGSVWRYLPARKFDAVIGGHRADLASLFSDRSPRLIVLWGLFLRYEFFRRHKSAIREHWLAPLHVSREEPNPDDLTIHIRSGPDIWQSMTDGRPVHPEYHALPFSFYADILASRDWKSVAIVTDNPRDPMVEKVQRYSKATLHSSSAVADFYRLRSSSNIVLSVSTFAWWAAWLSRAVRVFYPTIGLFDSEAARKRNWYWQQDLWVADESRYAAIRPKMANTPWLGSDDDRRLLLES